MTLLEAKVLDATHLELSQPIITPRGGRVFVAVSDSSEADEERGEWADVSAQALQQAYGECEPDYSAAMIKESNVEYGA